MNIYPNPVNENLNIEVSSLAKNSLFSLSSVNGQELLQKQITTAKTQIDISTLPSGIYFIRFISDKTVEVEKIIKQ